MNTYPLEELVSIESLAALSAARAAINAANPYFVRVIDNVIVSEREYQNWVANGGHAGSR